MDPLQLTLFCLFIVLSAFFSGTELALMSLSTHKVESLLREKRSGAKTLKKIKSKNEQLLITILIGNNLVNVWASVLASVITQNLANQFGLSQGMGIGIATGFVTIILLIFGEITPKTLAIKNAESISLLVAPVYSLMMFLLRPVTWITEKILHLIQFLLRIDKTSQKLSPYDVEVFIDMSKQEGAVENDEYKKIKNILDFWDTYASSVMTPRVEVDAVDHSLSIEEVCQYMLKHTHSRIPVYIDTIDHIEYVIGLKQAFSLREKENQDKKLSEVKLEKIQTVAENQRIDTIFSMFQHSRKHIALVLDEHGWTAGIITLEDIIETVFGDIKDESDEEEVFIQSIWEGKFLIKGSVIVEDMLEYLDLKSEDIHLGKSYEDENIAYLITDHLERLPKIGEKICLSGEKTTLFLTVKMIQKRKILDVEVTKQENKKKHLLETNKDSQKISEK